MSDDAPETVEVVYGDGTVGYLDVPSPAEIEERDRRVYQWLAGIGILAVIKEEEDGGDGPG